MCLNFFARLSAYSMDFHYKKLYSHFSNLYSTTGSILEEHLIFYFSISSLLFLLQFSTPHTFVGVCWLDINDRKALQSQRGFIPKDTLAMGAAIHLAGFCFKFSLVKLETQC